MSFAILLASGYVIVVAILLFTILVLMVLNRIKGFVEEEQIAIPTMVSPAFKIIKLMFLKVAISIETVLMVVAVMLTAFTTSYVATYLYSFTSIDAVNIPHTYSVLLISNHFVNQIEKELINVSTSPLSYIEILQIFHEIPVEHSSGASYLLPLLIKCKGYDIEKYNNTISYLCKYLVNNKYVALIDVSNRIVEGRIRVGDEEFLIIRENLSKYLSIPLLPGIFPIHTMGVMGGATITASTSSIIVMPFSKDLYNTICEGECDVKTFLLITSLLPSSVKNAIVDVGLKYFDIVAMRHDNVVDIYSPNLVPSMKTLMGVISSILIALIFSLSISGGLVEKVVRISEKLFLVGVSYDTITASTSMTLILVFIIFFAPFLILMRFSAATDISILSYILSAVASNILLTYRVARSLKSKSYRILPKSSLTINTLMRLDVEQLKQAIQRFFGVDDLFALSEIEVLKGLDEYNEVRIELIYKRSFATLVTVEIYEDKNKDVWSYNAYVDVWSMEELSKYEYNKIAALVLSKVQGVIMQCITKF
uniref:Uncharacterized protein n=1 Tax=Ignisphaera aggregans TaxID=334771 RepID=A0A7J2U343_9CREN